MYNLIKTYFIPFLVYLQVLWLCFGSAEDFFHPVTEEMELEPIQMVETLKKTLVSRGTSSISEIGRVFLRMDDDGNMGLSKVELKEGVRDAGMRLTADQLTVLFKQIDTDNNDNINIRELLSALNPVLNEVRVAIVKEAFKELDKTKDDILTIDDLKESFSVKHNLKFLKGEETEQQVLNKLLSNFDRDDDNKVTEDEFCGYFAQISASIDDDSYFELIVRQAYNLTT